jgi:hypothetical protein
LHYVAGIWLALSIAMLGCGDVPAPPPDSEEASGRSSEDAPTLKQMLAESRLKMGQIEQEYQRLESQRHRLLATLTKDGRLSAREAQQQPGWRTYARQLKIVTQA